MEWPSSTADPAHTLTGLTRSQDSHADRTHTQTSLTRCPQDWATRTSYELRHLAIRNGVEYQRKVNGTWKPLSRADVVRGLTAYYASPNTSEATSPIRQRRRQIMFKTRLKRTNASTQAAIGTAPTAVAAANLKRDQRTLKEVILSANIKNECTIGDSICGLKREPTSVQCWSSNCGTTTPAAIRSADNKKEYQRRFYMQI